MGQTERGEERSRAVSNVEQCWDCEEWYFVPVSYHHTAAECAVNIAKKEAAKAKAETERQKAGEH